MTVLHSCDLLLFHSICAQPTFLGKGDLHDRSFHNMVRYVEFFASQQEEQPWVSYDKDNIADADICNYWVELFPSTKFKEAYESNIAVVATVTVGATFVIVALIFMVYDFLVNKRNQKITDVAVKSNAVVNSLFPAEVRDRLLEGGNEKSAMGRSSLHDNGTNNGVGKSRPIAELYPDVTIMFCDIVGFTAWSSMREPHQVFELLEHLYGDYDRIARRRNVFKVETIGDCYVACCGLPKPRDDHAVVICRFANDCIASLCRLVKELEVCLGPDTGDLAVRVGVHSGSGKFFNGTG